jgi:triacylglycerol lipase
MGGDMRIGPVARASFKGIARAIARDGHPVFVSAVHPTAGIERRARQLKKWLLSIRPQFDSKRIVLIAHSLGGLDARYMLWRLDMADFVQTLITITTPHRGSPYADWFAKNLGRRLRGFRLMQRLGWDVDAIEDLTTERCARFNETIGDVPGVQYYSVSAARPLRLMPAFAIHSWSVVHRADGPNDGLVSVKSAQWGQHLGTWRADHWHTINRRYGLAAKIAGDISPHYLALLTKIGSV